MSELVAVRLRAGEEQIKHSHKKKKERRFGYICLFVMNLLALLQVHCGFIERSPGWFHLGCDQALTE